MGGLKTAIDAINLLGEGVEISGLILNQKATWNEEESSTTIRFEFDLELSQENTAYVIDNLNVDIPNELAASLKTILQSIE